MAQLQTQVATLATEVSAPSCCSCEWSRDANSRFNVVHQTRRFAGYLLVTCWLPRSCG